MRLKNITKGIRRLTIRGQVIYIQPGKTIEGEKIKFDSGAFEEVKKTDLNIVKKKKLKKENKI